jgi:uncharacterized protein (UPF0276 family)
MEAAVGAAAVADAVAVGANRFGLGWRSELSAGILTHLDEIDIVEVIADDYFADPKKQRALSTLASQVPVTLHGVGLGPASVSPVPDKRLADFARLIDRIRPDSWSEHLAWVRAGGHEIGHLAAPCRNASTIDGTLANLDRMKRAVGSAPVMENIATLIDPPASPISEADWLSGVLRGDPDTGLLLDLHNVHANSSNFCFNPDEFLASIPLDRVRTIHLAGGRMWQGRLLDDHLHDVPAPVFQLLEKVAARTLQPLTVLIERDGEYPDFDDLLEQVREARRAVARGRL